MKFGQLIEYNVRNIFLEKSYTKCGRETISKLYFATDRKIYKSSTKENVKELLIPG